MRSDRKTWLDVIRIVACLAVVVLHVSSRCWKAAFADDMQDWMVLNFYDSAVRWAVPVFVMVSGSLFLASNKPLGKIVKENIFRIIVSFYCWSLLYAIPNLVQSGNVEAFLAEFVFGHYHMWFLPMIVGLYLLLPFLRLIARDEGLAKYFLLMAFIFAFVLPQIGDLVAMWSEKAGRFLLRITKMPQIYFTLGYSSFFILGYRLDVMDRRISNFLLILVGLAGFLITFVGTSLLSIKGGTPTQVLYDNFSVTVLMEAMSVFLLLKNSVSKRCVGHRTAGVLAQMSGLSYGVYLIHPLLITVLDRIHFNALSFTSVVSVPVIAFVVVAASFGITTILQKIPVLGHLAV